MEGAAKAVICSLANRDLFWPLQAVNIHYLSALFMSLRFGNVSMVAATFMIG